MAKSIEPLHAVAGLQRVAVPNSRDPRPREDLADGEDDENNKKDIPSIGKPLEPRRRRRVPRMPNSNRYHEDLQIYCISKYLKPQCNANTYLPRRSIVLAMILTLEVQLKKIDLMRMERQYVPTAIYCIGNFLSLRFEI